MNYIKTEVTEDQEKWITVYQNRSNWRSGEMNYIKTEVTEDQAKWIISKQK